MLSIRRSVLWVAKGTVNGDESIKEVIPLDEYLGIKSLPFKMTRSLMVATAYWGQDKPSFKQAEKIIREMYNVSMTDDHIRKVTYYVGKKVFEADTREAEKIYGGLSNMEFKHDEKGILYIIVDDELFNTREKNDEGCTKKRHSRLGVVFSDKDIKLSRDGESEEIVKKEYVSYIGSVDEFKKYLLACAVRNGYGRYEKTVVLSGGADWIKEMCAEVFPEAELILDLYHLTENIYAFGKHIFRGEEENYIPWAEKLIELIKDGKKDEALEIMEWHRRKKPPRGKVNPDDLIRRNYDIINYGYYKGKGYYTGGEYDLSSGNQAPHKRCNHGRMRWDEKSAQYILTLKSKVESGLWEEKVKNIIIKHSDLR